MPCGSGSTHGNSILADLITAPHRSISSCKYLEVLSTEPPKISADNFCKRSCTWGRRNASFTSALILSVIALGVFGGATMAYQATASKPGSVSAIVGTLGRAGSRLGDATASNF